MITWATLAMLAAMWLAGHGVLGWCAPRAGRRQRRALEHHATAVLVGGALVTTVAMHAVIVFGPLSPWAGRGLVLALALPGVPLLFRRRVPAAGEATGLDEMPGEHVGLLGRLGLVIVLAFTAFAVFSAGTMPMHIFDPVYHFSYKAKLIFHEGFGTAAWTDVDGLVGRIITHPNYAPGGAVLNAAVGWIRGHFDQDSFRALCAIFVLAPAAWLWTALRPRGFRAALSGTLLWLTLPILYYTKLPQSESWSHSVYAFLFGLPAAKSRWPELGFGPADGQVLDGATDLVLAAFAFGAFLHLWRLLPASRLASDRTDVVAGGLLLSAAMLAKNEGLALAGVMLIAFTLAILLGKLVGAGGAGGPVPTRRVRAIPGALGVFAIGFALTSGWLAIRGDIPSIDENYPERLRIGNILEHGSRWIGNAEEPGVLLGFWWSFSHLMRWNLLWPLFFATLAWFALRPRRLVASPAGFAVLVVLGASVLYALILVVTPWHLGVLFGTVIPGRLLVHIAPLVVLATIAMLWRHEHEELRPGSG